MTMRQVLRGMILLTVAGVLLAAGGCAWLRQPTRDWHKSSREFAQRLRWGYLDVATQFVAEAQRPAFRAAFEDDTLRLTDVRLEQLEAADDSHVKSRLTIEYYRIPSTTIKKHVQTVDWECAYAGEMSPCSWALQQAPSPPP